MANKIYFDHANIGYDEDNPILTDVSFSIGEGEIVYLIGKTAVGKSSLLKTMYAEIPLLDGEAVIADYDLTKIKRKKFRISVVRCRLCSKIFNFCRIEMYTTILFSC